MTDNRLFDMALLLILAVLPRIPETALAPLDDTPDGPVPFGYKMGWLAAKCGDPHRLMEDMPGRTERLVDSFPEVQLFGTHRISDCHYWTKYVDGKVVRGYICQDAGVVWDEGGLTPEELALGFERFPGRKRESGWFPGEEDVLNTAAAWGVDPRFEKKTYLPSVGWVCD